MVGTKLDLLKQEINSYLGIPYFSNTKKTISSENALVGKGTAKEIALKTIELANLQNIKLLNLSSKQIYNFQKKNHLGIDCSGLVYNLLKIIEPKVDDILIGTEGKKGVRRLSANLLTSAPNAAKLSTYDVKPGDLIRADNGRHVIFIIEKINDTIHYIHSSDKTKISGVHLGFIEIINPQKPLNHQIWSDQTKLDTNYSLLIDPKKEDGIYRLNCLK